jgi:hypothetical protein
MASSKKGIAQTSFTAPWGHHQNRLVHVSSYPRAMRVVGVEPMGGAGEILEIDDSQNGWHSVK